MGDKIDGFQDIALDEVDRNGAKIPQDVIQEKTVVPKRKSYNPVNFYPSPLQTVTSIPEEDELPKRKLSETPSNTTNLTSFQQYQSQDCCSFPMFSFVTLKILIFDIGIALGDVITDFGQAWSLINSGHNMAFGFVTLFMNWLPGIAASIHIISMYRRSLPIKKTLMYAFLLLLFYPIVPFVAYIILLWNRPFTLNRSQSIRSNSSRINRNVVNQKSIRARRVSDYFTNLVMNKDEKMKKINSFEEQNKKYHNLEYFAMLAHAISGGIESPLQFSLQLWLIIKGTIPKPWTVDRDNFRFVDTYGNVTNLPSISGISLLFSILSMVKALIEFNIIRVHIEGINTCNQCWKFCRYIFDHLPFLASASFFRISSMVLLTIYFNEFGFIPVLIYWIGSVAIGYKNFRLDKVPLWLISFISLFFPACFTSIYIDSGKTRKNLIDLQYKTFFYQNILATVIYIPSLITLAVFINNNKAWSYDPKIILSNQHFNTSVIVTIAMGLISFVLSFHPNWVTLTQKIAAQVKEYITVTDTNAEASEGAPGEDFVRRKNVGNKFAVPTIGKPKEKIFRKRIFVRILLGFIVLIFAFSPVIIGFVVLSLTSRPNIYIYRQVSTNHMKIIQAIPVLPSKMEKETHISGCLTNFGNDQSKNGNCEKPILIMSRSMWPECFNKNCYANSSAIIINDNDYVCGSNKSEYCFRPSYSLSDLTNPPIPILNLPMVLVQEPDVNDLILNQESDSIFGLIYDKKNLPEPSYVCNRKIYGAKKCAPKEKFINDDGTINGLQTRHTVCLWGNKPCLGFKNNEEEQEWCDSHKAWTMICTIDSEDIKWSEESKFSNVNGNTFRMYGPLNGSEKHCLNEMNILVCQKWSKCTRQYNHNRRRYCKVNDSCILEEKGKINSTVCLDKKEDMEIIV